MSNPLIHPSYREQRPNQHQQLVVTKTGEPYQPVRIYYQVFNAKATVGAFKKLRCMEFKAENSHWLWLYEQEARKLKFDVPYHEISKSDRPLILGTFYLPTAAEMVLDVRSFDRALYAVEFFSKRINRRVAQANRLRVVNRFFSAEEIKPLPLHELFDQFFNREDVKVPDPEALEAQLQALKATTANLESNAESDLESAERNMVLIKYLEELARQPLPEVEELAIDIQDLGLGPLIMALKMRQVEAFERWKGNTNINQLEIMQQLLAFAPDEEALES